MGKDQQIGAVLSRLQSNNVNLQAIEKNLTTITDIDEKEIDGIVQILRSLSMPVEDNILIMSYVTTEELEGIVKTLRDNNVSNDIIVKELKGIIVDIKRVGIQLEEILGESVNDDRKEHFRSIKKYMRLTGKYGTYFTRDDIEEICSKKHITPREFIAEMLSSKEQFVDFYYNKIMAGGRLYIGPAKPIDKKYLEEHSEDIMELSRISAGKFARATVGYDVDELQSLALGLIVNQCGGFVDNLNENQDALRGSIINRTTKYLYSVAETKAMSITQTHTSRAGITFTSDNEIAHDANENPYESDNQESTLQDTVDYQKAQFDSVEAEVMECMIRLIEEGEADDLYKKIARNVVMEEEEVLQVIHSIRQKMIQNKLVKQHEGRGFIFNKSGDQNDTKLSFEEDESTTPTGDDFDM